jgi:hypothetical protein
MDTNRLHNLAISDTGFIFDPVTGNSYNTNQTGIVIINRLKSGDDVAAVAQAVSAEYDVSPETAEHDVIELIETLRSNYLV